MTESNEHIKEPEKIPLPKAVQPQKQVSTFEVPYFVILNQEKQRNKEAFDNKRRNDRVERLKAIQKLRSSKVVVYYSVDILSPNDVELLFDLLQSVKQQKKLDLFL